MDSETPTDLSFPLSGRDCVLTALCALGGALAASSGVGGGVIFVPLMLSIAKLPVLYAAPISNFVIALSAVSTFVINMFQTHPTDSSRPLITFEALVYFVPIALSSTSIGLMMNKALPAWFVNILLFSFLSLAAFRMLTRAIKVFKVECQEKRMKEIAKDEMNRVDSHDSLKDTDYLLLAQKKTKEANQNPSHPNQTNGNQKKKRSKKEKNQKNKKDRTQRGNTKTALNLSDEAEEETTMVENSTTNGKEEREEGGGAGVVEGEGETKIQVEILSIEQRRSEDSEESEESSSAGEGGTGAGGMFGRLLSNMKSIKWWFWVIIFGMWAFQVGLAIVRNRAVTCSALDFVALCAQPAVGVLVGLKVAHLLIKRYREETSKATRQFCEGDVVLGESWNNMIRMMGFCLVIGVLGGLLGVGGGSIIAPMLLELGATPAVVAPISSSLVLFSSSQAFVQFAIGDTMLWNYAIWLGLINLAANCLGLYAVKKIVQKLGFNSFIVFSLGILLVLAAVFTIIFLVKDLDKNGFTPFPPYCSSQ